MSEGCALGRYRGEVQNDSISRAIVGNVPRIRVPRNQGSHEGGKVVNTAELAEMIAGPFARYTPSDRAFLLLFHFTLDIIAEMLERGETEYHGIDLQIIVDAAGLLSDERT